ncbi:MAG: glycine cleavage system protein T [Prevotella sp.]|nr:glycine cleavage system protein T [Prevotella sp.]
MENKRTCLYDKHVALGALMSPFGGFDMPIQYSDIKDEHNAVRTACGVFDVSHMGEVTVYGRDAVRYVNHIFTNDVTGMPAGKILYGMMLYEDGGTVDDLLVYKLGDDSFFLVINAANIDKDWEWMQRQAAGFDIELRNESDSYGQIAVQGPQAEAVMEEVLGIRCSELSFYTFKNEERRMKNEESENEECRMKNEESGCAELPRQQILHSSFFTFHLISRTGYTGEDGFEIYGTHEYIRGLWDKLMASGRCKPCGLGCRDTLRFEVGLPLYGDELSADISPIMAGLGIFCKLGKEEFIGREALVRQKAEGVSRKLVGIELADKAIPRHGYAVLKDGVKIGEVTTGYHTISTDKSVCMALIDTAHAALDTPVEIQIRKKTFPGKVVKKKFYDKHYHK